MSDLTLRRDNATGQSDNATVVLIFSEPVIGFNSDNDITIPNLDQAPRHDNTTPSGTLDNMTSSDNITWEGIFIPTFPNTEDWTNRLVLSDNFTDVDNNTGTGAQTSNYMVDDIYPIVHGAPTIYLDVDNRSNDNLILWAQHYTEGRDTVGQTSGGGGDAYLYVNFQEPVTANFDTDNTTTNVASFSNADIDLDNATGTLRTMTAYPSDNKTIWRAQFKPTLDREVDNNTITLEATWTDQVGNPGTSVTTSNFVVETYRPQATFTITIADNTTCAYSVCGTYADGSFKKALAPGDNGTLTVSFADPNPEPIFNFNSDSDIDNTTYVTLSTMTSDDNITWTGTFTPVDNSTGAGVQQQNTQSSSYNVRFLLRDGSFNDIKGNPGDDVYSEQFIVDTKAPYVTKVTLDDGITDLDDDVQPNSDGSPFNNRCIPIHSDIYVTFDYFMNPDTITSNPSDSNCTGTLQVSSDNFSTANNCVKIAHPPAASNSNKTFKLDPVDNLTYNTTYTVRVETGVEDALENNMASEFTHSGRFRTSAFHSSSPTSGAFLAVGHYGETFRSIDNGTSWDNGTCIFLEKHLNGVAYGNNTFVAVGESGKITRSTDNGSSWSNSTSGINTRLKGVAFGNNTFVAVGDSNRIVRSTDNGISWSSPSSGVSYHYLKGVTFGNNIFEVVGQSSWANSSNNNQNTRYVRILKSTDNGTNWTSQDSPDNKTKDLYGVTYGSNKFVAVGENGRIVRSTNNSGTSWGYVTTGVSPYPYGSEKLRSVAFGSNTFVAVGASGKILRSTNSGASWSNSTSGTSRELYAVTFANNTFVAVGQTGTILTSPDGITWTTRTSGTSNSLYGVTFGE